MYIARYIKQLRICQVKYYTNAKWLISVCQHSVNITVDSWHSLNQHHPLVHHSGSYMPEECTARQRIAIIIPYKGREQQLKVLLNNLHPFLQRQQAHYTIFVVEPVNIMRCNSSKHWHNIYFLWQYYVLFPHKCIMFLFSIKSLRIREGLAII